MLVFPKNTNSKSRRSRRRRRRRRKNRRNGGADDDSESNEDDSSSCSDSDDDEEDGRRSRKSQRKVNISLAIGQLRHLDAAFVRRSDGQWTYSLVADGDSTQIRFVVNARGSTKSFPQSLWESCIRRIRVLTPRHGDRFAFNSKPKRKKRSIGGSRSFRSGSRGGKGKGGRRFVSPSPTRRNSGVLNLPPTIMEGKEHD